MTFPSWQQQTDLRSLHLSPIQPLLLLTNQLPPLHYLRHRTFCKLASRYLSALYPLPSHLEIPSHRPTDFKTKRNKQVRPTLTPTLGETRILTNCWPQSTASVAPCNDAIASALDNLVHVPPLIPPPLHGVPLHRELHVPFAMITLTWTTKAISICQPPSTPIRQTHPRERPDRVQDRHNTIKKNLMPPDIRVFISLPYFLWFPKLYMYIYIYLIKFHTKIVPTQTATSCLTLTIRQSMQGEIRFARSA